MKTLDEAVKQAKVTASLFGYASNVWKAGSNDFVPVAGSSNKGPKGWRLAARVTRDGRVIKEASAKNPKRARKRLTASESRAVFDKAAAALPMRYRGYWIKENALLNALWIEKDGFAITAPSSTMTISAAKKIIDELAASNPANSRASYKHKRLRPGKLDKRSLRTVTSGKAKIIIGCPAGKYDAKRKSCKVGTRAKAVLTPKKSARRNPPRRKSTVRNALMGAALAAGIPFERAAKEVAKIMTRANKLKPGEILTVRAGQWKATIKAIA